MNTEALRDMATRLRTVAADTDQVADDQAKHAHAAHGVSDSGDIFREGSMQVRGLIHGNADHLIATAARLDQVAATVDDRVAAIAAAAAATAQVIEDGVESTLEAGAQFVEDATGALSDGVDVLGDLATRVFR